MRPKTQTFEQLVKQNKQELWEDERRLNQIEVRLEKKREKLVSAKQQKRLIHD
ncbi:FbpB family small basic protein [Lentibacillus sp. N15]|uniref:FbpB family small basic protein n=1 Tax=Lentibacillus songyuanensis TaxID=3136161 RepID=UPI0031B9B13D